MEITRIYKSCSMYKPEKEFHQGFHLLFSPATGYSQCSSYKLLPKTQNWLISSVFICGLICPNATRCRSQHQYHLSAPCWWSKAREWWPIMLPRNPIMIKISSCKDWTPTPRKTVTKAEAVLIFIRFKSNENVKFLMILRHKSITRMSRDK